MKSNILLEAHSWLGTAFKHQGRIKKTENHKGGCDCLGLILGLNIKTKTGDDLKIYDKSDYPKILTSNILQNNLSELLITIAKENIQEGDILLIKLNEIPQHLAIVAEINNNQIIIIHSYLQARKVVKQILAPYWQENIVQIFRSS